MQRHLTLFADHVQIPAGSHLLISQLDDAELIAQLAEQHVIAIFHRDYAIACRLRNALEKYPQITFHDRALEDAQQKYDAVLLQIPKSRGFAQALLFTNLWALKIGASLYAMGPTHAGANTALTDAAMLGPTTTVANRARHRLFIVKRPARLMPPDEWNLPWQPRPIEMSVADQTYRVNTQPGIFSWDRVDDGTRFLIEHFEKLRGGSRILDAGCGYGLLGLAAISHFSPARLVLVDTDLLAIVCARSNLSGTEIVAHDLTHSPLPGEIGFDLILCNPPFHQAHEKDLSFMQRFPAHARKMLAPGGQLAIVANSFLPYQKLLAQHFQSVIKLNDNGRFQILLASDDIRAP
jgi:16S rRNA (guanine1207-N2)-methyltransferase